MSAYEPSLLNRDEIFIPHPVLVERTFRLGRTISAVRLERGAECSRARLGEIRTLHAGETVEVCGAGYNDKTAKIRCNGEFFFVFKGDLSPDPLH
ncbi:MAG: hypothetical protein JO270_15180 [Acidobacteriaceae bacterium]|nr:hypothetical protein [Acidobacteriaceae bacterium]